MALLQAFGDTPHAYLAESVACGGKERSNDCSNDGANEANPLPPSTPKGEYAELQITMKAHMKGME